MVVRPMPHRIWPMAVCHGFTALSDGGGSAAASSWSSSSKRRSSVIQLTPNFWRNPCRRRYSRPSTARSVRPSSAAIWAVDWQ